MAEEANGQTNQSNQSLTAEQIRAQMLSFMGQRMDQPVDRIVEWMFLPQNGGEADKKTLALLGYIAHQLFEIRTLLEKANGAGDDKKSA